ncbi:MAG: hypothetical protein ABR500_14660 [Dermatophilaceae bacterium]|nr:hypothetical protein [Intrasporangiaceae bacterium]
MKRIIVALAAAVTLTLTAAPAQADTYLGPKWETPATVSDQTGDPSLDVSRAVNQWAKAGVSVKMTTSTSAPIKVTYAQLGDHVAGLAWVAYAGTRMVGCHIQIDEEMRGAAQRLKRKVVTHEMGHCIGLGDNPGYYSIMGNADVTEPTRGDKRAARALYGR